MPSVLERVNGELADLLTGGSGGERVLQDLEEANAFVVSLDADRSWFRYHQLFAGLLQLELRRTAPGEVTGLHQAASAWFAARGHPVEAIRHAQQARDWPLAARRSRSTRRSNGRPSTAGRRSGWRSSMAGSAIRPSASPTWHSERC